MGVGDEVAGYDQVKSMGMMQERANTILRLHLCVGYTAACITITCCTIHTGSVHFTLRVSQFFNNHPPYPHAPPPPPVLPTPPTPQPQWIYDRENAVEIPRFCFKRKVWTLLFITHLQRQPYADQAHEVEFWVDVSPKTIYSPRNNPNWRYL